MPQRPQRKLGKKLRAIREHLGLTLDQMARALGRQDASRRSRVYEWEQGTREPDLQSLLKYAQLVGVSTDVLIDDTLDLNLTR